MFNEIDKDTFTIGGNIPINLFTRIIHIVEEDYPHSRISNTPTGEYAITLNYEKE